MTLVTEKEAAEKWCPLTRVALEGVASNRFGEPGGSYVDMLTRCIGSRCMAWRSAVWDHQRNLTPENRTPGVGYCGAFGKVEP